MDDTAGQLLAGEGEALRERAETEHRKLVAAKTARRLEAEARDRAEKASRTAARRSKRGLDPETATLAHASTLRSSRAGTARREGSRGVWRRGPTRRGLTRRGCASRSAMTDTSRSGDVRRSHGTMVEVPAGAVACGDGMLAFGDLRVDAGEKIGVVGRNGTGSRRWCAT